MKISGEECAHKGGTQVLLSAQPSIFAFQSVLSGQEYLAWSARDLQLVLPSKMCCDSHLPIQPGTISRGMRPNRTSPHF